MNIPEDLKYTDSHEWVRHEEGVATVGITDHAQEELSELVYVELPEVGRQVEKGEPVAVVESVKAASDIYAPLGGEVAAVNDSLADSPDQINQAPYDLGWLFKIKPSNESDLDSLLGADSYAKEIG